MHLSPLVQLIHNYAILHHTTLADLTGPSQKWPLVHLRQEAYYLCCIDPSKPTMRAIGDRFHRDRTTVMHGIEAHCTKVGIPMPELARYPQRRPRKALEMGEGTNTALVPYSAPAAFCAAVDRPQMAAELEQET